MATDVVAGMRSEDIVSEVFLSAQEGAEWQITFQLEMAIGTQRLVRARTLAFLANIPADMAGDDGGRKEKCATTK